RMGFHITHVYGLTEVYGPAVVCDWHEEWNHLPAAEQARLKSRQGVRYTVMKGYFKNPKATDDAFKDGWFHSGDLGVRHPDGYIELKDRSKDIIISGGENISSIEVEDALFKHPAVQAAAVVAKPDEKWGETPCAFVELKPQASASVEEIIAW